MPGSDDPLERLRAAIDELAGADAADLLAEARMEARARVRASLTDALVQSMLEQLQPPARAARTHRPRVADAAPPPSSARPSVAANAAGPGERAWYVYGVVAAGAELSGALDGIDPTQPVTILREGPLAAVTSRVPLEEFDESRLREHLADMTWVEATARTHEAVLDSVREQATVIPMRMCTVYRTEGGIREMLSRESAPLQEALDHLDGKSEWGVKLFADIARAGGRTQHVDAGAGDSPGAAYMELKRTEQERREQAMEAAEEAAALVHERLSARASDAQLVPLQRREATGHAGDMILNGVYLVADDAVEAFHAEVEALRSELEQDGLEVEPTGPWPAYNFVPGTMGAAW